MTRTAQETPVSMKRTGPQTHGIANVNTAIYNRLERAQPKNVLLEREQFAASGTTFCSVARACPLHPLNPLSTQALRRTICLMNTHVSVFAARFHILYLLFRTNFVSSGVIGRATL